MFKNIYQFHILLEHTKPRIWRRIQVPDNYTMWDLHVAIQDAMGWYDYHLHQFSTVEKNFRNIIYVGIPDDTGMMDIITSWEEPIKKWFNLDDKKRMDYEYDFGDGWAHKITLEKILLVEKNIKYPICIAGKNMCPLEDSGGVWGYYDKIDIMNNPQHEMHEEIMEWIVDKFDLTEFDIKDVEFDDPKRRLKDMLSYR